MPVKHKQQAETQPATETETNGDVTETRMQPEAPAIETRTSADAPVVSQDQVRAAADAAVRADRLRQSQIRDLVRKHNLPVEFGDELAVSDKTIDQARAAILDKLADQTSDIRSAHPIIITEDERDKWLRGAANWLYVKAGTARSIAQADKVEASTFDPGEFRGLSLVDLARESLERAGKRTRGMDKMSMVGEAFMARASITQSTSDFAVLLENTMHKTLVAAYGLAADTWSMWCARGTVSDFRIHNRYRFGFFGGLDDLNENGEYKNKAILDGEKSTIQAATKGNMINVSRQMIINDDMQVFNRLLPNLGRAAKLSEEILAYGLLLANSGLGPTMSDSKAFFHTDHKNINSTGSALGVAGLDADRVVMGSQTDPNDKEYLDLRPAVLLVPIGLGGEARTVNDMEFDDTNSKFRKPNKVRGLFQTVVDTPRITGTRRYLFADPNVAPAFEIAFLEGNEMPVLESQNGWRVDGVEMRVRHDIGGAAIDTRGAVTNAGA